jgi:uncharacterized Zn-finger protein
MSRGLNVHNSSKEGRVINSILDVLQEVALSMEEFTARQEDLEEYVSAIDEDLADLEDMDNDEDWVEIESNDLTVDDEDEIIEEEAVLEVECPYCHDDFDLYQDAFDGHPTIHVTCPSCHEVLRVDDIDEDFQDYYSSHPHEEP